MTTKKELEDVRHRYNIVCKQLRRTEKNLARKRKLKKGREYAVECLKIAEQRLFLKLAELGAKLITEHAKEFIERYFAF